jgi:hypothetical protein
MEPECRGEPRSLLREHRMAVDPVVLEVPLTWSLNASMNASKVTW